MFAGYLITNFLKKVSMKVYFFKFFVIGEMSKLSNKIINVHFHCFNYYAGINQPLFNNALRKVLFF